MDLPLIKTLVNKIKSLKAETKKSLTDKFKNQPCKRSNIANKTLSIYKIYKKTPYTLEEY